MQPGPKRRHVLLSFQCQLLHFCVMCCAAQLIPGQVRACRGSFPTSQMILCMGQTVNQILLIKYATCAVMGGGIADVCEEEERLRQQRRRGEEPPPQRKCWHDFNQEEWKMQLN